MSARRSVRTRPPPRPRRRPDRGAARPAESGVREAPDMLPSSQPQSGPSGLVPVVGIGASAGGFEAFSQMLAGLPTHLDAAFVFVQHLDPTHESVLDDLLAKTTPIPVRQAAESM